jgi:hypothetical protein
MLAAMRNSPTTGCGVPALGGAPDEPRDFGARQSLPEGKARHTYFLSLSIFRILFGVYLVLDALLHHLPYARAFYSDVGLYPRTLALQELHAPDAWSVLFIAGVPWVVTLLLVIYTLAALSFLVGYRTRLMTGLLLVGAISIYWRSTPLNAGMDVLARLLLLWSLFVPLARYYSVDTARDPAAPNRPTPWLPVLALKAQVSMMYVFSGLYKLAGESWVQGTALVWLLQGNVFLGGWLGPDLLQGMAPWHLWLCWGILGFQIAFPLLVYAPVWNNGFRAIAIVGGVAMHASFLLFLNVGWFPWLCFAYMVLLVPDAWWETLFAAKRSRLAQVVVWYQPGCGFCQRVALLLRAFCLPPTVPVRPADTDPEAMRLLVLHDSWVVRDEAGKHRLGWDAVAYVLCQAWWSAPLGWVYVTIPAWRPAQERLYAWVGRQRAWAGAWLATAMPWYTPRELGWPAQAVCGGLLVLAVAVNALQMPKPAVMPFGWQPLPMPVMPDRADHWLSRLSVTFQVNQRWNLFAPNPTSGAFQFMLLGTLADGTVLDVQRRLPEPIVWPVAGGDRVGFVNHRYLKLFERLHEPVAHAARRRALLHHLCHEVNRDEALPRVMNMVLQIFDYQKAQTIDVIPRWTLRVAQTVACEPWP